MRTALFVAAALACAAPAAWAQAPAAKKAADPVAECRDKSTTHHAQADTDNKRGLEERRYDEAVYRQAEAALREYGGTLARKDLTIAQCQSVAQKLSELRTTITTRLKAPPMAAAAKKTEKAAPAPQFAYATPLQGCKMNAQGDYDTILTANRLAAERGMKNAKEQAKVDAPQLKAWQDTLNRADLTLPECQALAKNLTAARVSAVNRAERLGKK